MTVREISEEAIALADRLIEVTKGETSALCRQQAIEIMMAAHAIRMTGPREPVIVIDGMAKHAKQLIGALKVRGNV